MCHVMHPLGSAFNTLLILSATAYSSNSVLEVLLDIGLKLYVFVPIRRPVVSAEASV